MIIPIRCFSCGSLIADKYEKFLERVKKGDEPKKVLDELGLNKYCCRRMIISHVELIDEIAKFREIM
ncbi:MAG: DNA-directed RNA polymerase subunit N [Euryarchaeota archaeon]|nr:DNA-directed RNA polymerase subunit N [Euryarchaeota archaeon]